MPALGSPGPERLLDRRIQEARIGRSGAWIDGTVTSFLGKPKHYIAYGVLLKKRPSAGRTRQQRIPFTYMELDHTSQTVFIKVAALTIAAAVAIPNIIFN